MRLVQINTDELEKINGGVIPAVILGGLAIYGTIEAGFSLYDKVKLAYNSYRNGYYGGR